MNTFRRITRARCACGSYGDLWQPRGAQYQAACCMRCLTADLYTSTPVLLGLMNVEQFELTIEPAPDTEPSQAIVPPVTGSARLTLDRRISSNWDKRVGERVVRGGTS